MPNPHITASTSKVRMLAIIIPAVVVAFFIGFLLHAYFSALYSPANSWPPPPPPLPPKCYFPKTPNISINPGSTYAIVLGGTPTAGCWVYVSLCLLSYAPVDVKILDESNHVYYQWSGTTYIHELVGIGSPPYSDIYGLTIYNPNSYTAEVYLSYAVTIACGG